MRERLGSVALYPEIYTPYTSQRIRVFNGDSVIATGVKVRPVSPRRHERARGEKGNAAVTRIRLGGK